MIIIFTVLNTLLSFCLKWFYRKDKEIATDIENHEKISVLSEQLSQSVDEIKKFKQQIENLQKINQSLSSKSLEINVSDISKKDYNDLVNLLRSRPNSEKLLFSFKELISSLKKNKDMEIERISVTYEKDYNELLKILDDYNLLNIVRNTWNGQKHINKLEMSRSFKDFLSIEN